MSRNSSTSRRAAEALGRAIAGATASVVLHEPVRRDRNGDLARFRLNEIREHEHGAVDQAAQESERYEEAKQARHCPRLGAGRLFVIPLQLIVGARSFPKPGPGRAFSGSSSNARLTITFAPNWQGAGARVYRIGAPGRVASANAPAELGDGDHADAAMLEVNAAAKSEAAIV